MASDRKRTKRKPILKDELEKPTKEEYTVAKCLKFNAPYKEAKFQGNSAQYFIGSKIVDFLMDSKWSSKKNTKNFLFSTRMSCVIYCARLLEKGFFHRVERPEKKDKNKKNTDKNKDTTTTLRKRTKKEEGEDTAKEESKDEEKKKKKRPPKLKMHLVQEFVDGPDLYVWIYDPTPLLTYVIGLLLVVGVIGVCLFPLWPPELKVAIYYLSCTAICLIGMIFVLWIVRGIVYIVVWLSTMGGTSFWLLPNLTEDVGFIESFKPLYCVSYNDAEKALKKAEDEEEEDGGDDNDADKGADEKAGGDNGDEKGDDDDDEKNKHDDKGNEDDDDDKNTNSSNGYEIVNPEDYELDDKNEEDEDEEEDEEEDGYDDDGLKKKQV